MSGNFKVAVFLLLLPIFIFAIEISMAEDIKHLILLQRYNEAADLAQRAETESLGDFLHLLIRHSEIIDYESFSVNGEELEGDIESFLRRYPASASDTNSYFSAVLTSAKGLSLLKRGRTVAGAGEARSGFRQMENLLKRYPENVSLLEGVGAARYYTATALRFIPFAGGNPQSGVELLEQAVSAQCPSSYTARQSLFWIYMEQQRYEEALNLANEVLDRYPNNTLMIRGKCRALLLSGRYELAYQCGHQLEELSRVRDIPNTSDRLSAAVVMANALKEQGRIAEALSICHMGLQVPISSRERSIEWIQRHRNSLRELQKELKQ